MRNIIGDTAVFFLILAFLLFVVKFKKQNKAYKIFTVYLAIISCCEIYYRVSYLFTKNNIPVTHLDTLVQFLLLSWFFAEFIANQHKKRAIQIGGILVPLLFVIKFALNPKLLLKYDDYETFVTSMILVVYGTNHLYNMLNETKKFYYVTVGMLIYMVGSIVIVLTGNILIALNDLKMYNKIWIFNNLFYLAFQIFVLYEWYKTYYKKLET